MQGYQSRLIYFRNIIWLPWQRPLVNWKNGTDPSSARNALSYGVKIAKIGPVDAEILDQIGPFFGRVIPDVLKGAMSTLELLDRISGNFDTIYRHHFRC